MNEIDNTECGLIGNTPIKNEKRLENDTTKISGIYKIVNGVNEKYYIGSAKNIYKRWIRHKSDFVRNVHHNDHLLRSWNKYGENNFDFILMERVNEKDLLLVEQKYLNICKMEPEKCYNTSFIAGRVVMTPEIRKKISNSQKGKIHKKGIENPLYGIKIPKERKERIGLSMMGSKNHFYGKHHNDKTKEILRYSRTGAKNQNYDYTIYIFKNIETGYIFVGTRNEFYKNNQFDARVVRKLIRGILPSYKKWIILNNKINQPRF